MLHEKEGAPRARARVMHCSAAGASSSWRQRRGRPRRACSQGPHPPRPPSAPAERKLLLVVRHGQAVSNFLSDTLGPDEWFAVEGTCEYTDKDKAHWDIFDAGARVSVCLWEGPLSYARKNGDTHAVYARHAAACARRRRRRRRALTPLPLSRAHRPDRAGQRAGAVAQLDACRRRLVQEGHGRPPRARGRQPAHAVRAAARCRASVPPLAAPAPRRRAPTHLRVPGTHTPARAAPRRAAAA